MKAEIVPLLKYSDRRGFHGTMCVYLPQRVVQHMLGCREEFMTPTGEALTGAHGFDFWLKENAATHGGMFACVPNPVNHRPGYSTWGKQEEWQDFQSTTFRTTPLWQA